MNIKVETDYKNLSEQQAKALKILNERLRNKEKELKKLYQQMAQLRNEERKKKKLKQKIDKAIEYIESYNLGKYDYSIPPIGIIELLKILKDSDVDVKDKR